MEDFNSLSLFLRNLFQILGPWIEIEYLALFREYIFRLKLLSEFIGYLWYLWLFDQVNLCIKLRCWYKLIWYAFKAFSDCKRGSLKIICAACFFEYVFHLILLYGCIVIFFIVIVIFSYLVVWLYCYMRSN